MFTSNVQLDTTRGNSEPFPSGRPRAPAAPGLPPRRLIRAKPIRAGERRDEGRRALRTRGRPAVKNRSAES